jgi:hypothetical protein
MLPIGSVGMVPIAEGIATLCGESFLAIIVDSIILCKHDAPDIAVV